MTVTPGMPIIAASIFSGSDSTSGGYVRDLLTPLESEAPDLYDAKRTFGPREQVDPVRFLIGLARGFGGLSEEEAIYAIEAHPRPAGRYRLTIKDPPLDGSGRSPSTTKTAR